MAVSRYSGGKDGRPVYERQKVRRCDLEVVPFGKVFLHRFLELAIERHQALEYRWAKRVWMGHAMGLEHLLGGHGQRCRAGVGDQEAHGERTMGWRAYPEDKGVSEGLEAGRQLISADVRFRR